LKILFICDIDGTIVPQEFSINEPNPEKAKSLKLSPKTLITLHMMRSHGDLIFLTGRGIGWQNITCKLLRTFLGKSKIHFHNLKGEWSMEKYLDFKLKNIKKISESYDIITIIDDMVEVLEYIKENFNQETKKLFLMHAKYDPIEEDMICYRIL